MRRRRIRAGMSLDNDSGRRRFGDDGLTRAREERERESLRTDHEEERVRRHGWMWRRARAPFDGDVYGGLWASA